MASSHRAGGGNSRLLDMRAQFQAKMQEEKEKALEAYRIMNEERSRLKKERDTVGEAFRGIPSEGNLQKFYGERSKQNNGLPHVDVQDSPEVRKKQTVARRSSLQPGGASSVGSDKSLAGDNTPRSAPLARKALPTPPAAQRESHSAGKKAVLAPIGNKDAAGAPSPAGAHPEPPLLDKIKRTREQKVETLRSKSAEKQRLLQEAQRGKEAEEPKPQPAQQQPQTQQPPALQKARGARENSQISQPIIASSKVIPGSNGRGSVSIKQSMQQQKQGARVVAEEEEEAAAAAEEAKVHVPQKAPEPKKSPPIVAKAAARAPPAAKPAPLQKKPSDAELALEAHERMQDEQRSKEVDEQRQAEEEKKRAAAEVARKKKAEIEDRKKREEERKRKIKEREMAREEARRQKQLEKERQEEERLDGEDGDEGAPTYIPGPSEPEEPIPTMRNAGNPNTSGVDLYELALDNAEGAVEEVGNLVPCDICNRQFAEERIDKHRVVCERAANKKRKAFDVKNQRLQAMGSEAIAFAKQAKKKDAQYEAKAKRADWRQKHEDFIAAIRAAKDPTAAPAPPAHNPDHVKCEGCGRSFNPSAAEKHIPKCKERAQRDKMKKK